MKRFSKAAFALLFTVCAVSSSYAIIGAGVHWGYDLSLSMNDKRDDVVDINIPLPAEILDLGLDLPDLPAAVKINRLNWDRSVINFGGKAYIDFLPVIGALEVSCNFGLWQYDGSIDILDVTEFDISNPNATPYTTIKLGLNDVDLKYLSLKGTPYAKLQLDASVRMDLFSFPPVVKMVKVSYGGGVSAHFATPVLSSKLIEDVLASKTSFSGMGITDIVENKDFSKAIVQKIIDDAMGKPVIGMHVLLGAQVKIPFIPIGAYVDGKYMIPFTKFDSEVGSDVKGSGILVNFGLSLSI